MQNDTQIDSILGAWAEGTVSGVCSSYQYLAWGCTVYIALRIRIDNIWRLGMPPKCLHMLKVLKRENFSA